MFLGLGLGHKAVLLTVTRLAEVVQDRTLVLLDEPETHLRLPLLSALARALSGLLSGQGSAAVIATHSPVVLREVPRDCMWVLRRSGSVTRADRPQAETFGENIGTLTSEVLGLEVTESGFYKKLAQAAAGKRTYAEVLQEFDGKLGSEARAIAQALAAASPSRRPGRGLAPPRPPGTGVKAAPPLTAARHPVGSNSLPGVAQVNVQSGT